MTTLNGTEEVPNTDKPSRPRTWRMKMAGLVLVGILIGAGSAIPVTLVLFSHLSPVYALAIGALCGVAAAVGATVGLAAGFRAFSWLL